MDLTALRVFVKVAELESFTRAAEHLGMPKARTSARVQALEKQLGTKLLQRTTRSVKPTRDGEMLLPRAKQLVAEADELGAMFQSSRTLKGTVRIDVPASMARDVIIPRVPELLALHPQLELQVSATDRRADVMREGFDVVLRVGNLTPSSLIAKRIGTMQMATCASAAYVGRHGRPQTIEDLANHDLVHYAPKLGEGDPPELEYREGEGYATAPMRASLTVNSTDAYRAACLAGLGIIQVPRYGVRALLEAGTLVELLPDRPCQPMPVWLVHSHGRNVPKRVRVVMGWVATLVGAGLG